MKTTIFHRIPWQKLSRHLIPNAGTLVLIALMFFAYNAWAAPGWAPNAQTTSGSFPYQGTLTGASGDPITADVDMIFRLYNVSTGSTALWEEIRAGVNAVPVENGLFQVMVGGITSIPNSVWENDTLYLGIQVGGDPEMSPREIVGSVPNAIQANVALVALTVQDRSISSDQLENHLCCGSTNTDGTGWQNYSDGRGIYIDIDTSSCGFSSSPMYFTSLAGSTRHWTTIGITSIYQTAVSHFRVYLDFEGDSQTTVADADESNWHVQWCGVEK